ncbi:MAG: DUF4397 domain-containing protein [Nannocystaceae bacterium]|nr:DUF4397 domain-containing protein [Nannocystaceae bacterium]
MTTRLMHMALLLPLHACGSSDSTNTADEAEGGTAAGASSTSTTDDDDDGSTAVASETVRLRIAHMSVDGLDVIVCVDGEPIAPLGATPIAYPNVTAYLDVPTDAEVTLLPVGSRCHDDTQLDIDLDLAPGAWATLVLFGDPALADRPLELRLLLDETDLPPTSANLARARNFHVDVDIGAIDVGVSPALGVQLMLFDNVPYGGTAQGSDIGTLTERGYVDGALPMVPTDRLNIWTHGTTEVLGWLPTDPPALQAGAVHSIFAAGKVLSGTPEAVVCLDTVAMATAEALWTRCQVFIPVQR